VTKAPIQQNSTVSITTLIIRTLPFLHSSPRPADQSYSVAERWRRTFGTRAFLDRVAASQHGPDRLRTHLTLKPDVRCGRPRLSRITNPEPVRINPAKISHAKPKPPTPTLEIQRPEDIVPAVDVLKRPRAALYALATLLTSRLRINNVALVAGLSLRCAVSAKSPKLWRQFKWNFFLTDSGVRVLPAQPRSRSLRCYFSGPFKLQHYVDKILKGTMSLLISALRRPARPFVHAELRPQDRFFDLFGCHSL
jgi:hypothetical protein